MGKMRIAGAAAAIMALMLAACGEDRTGEYYALTDGQRWIYDTMQENYLFYEDLPEESSVNFFQTPAAFLNSIASGKDKKNGSLYSHVDSVEAVRASSSLSYGIEGVMVRNDSVGDYAMHVLYVEPASPASEAGLKRGDWVIAVDNAKLSSNDYSTYFGSPVQAHQFTLGKLNAQNLYDTLQTITMPAPRTVVKQNLYLTRMLEANGEKIAYVMYNEFGSGDSNALTEAFANLAASSPKAIILDLRYNPGGYLSAAQLLATLLAPQEAMGKTFINLTYNSKLDKTETLTFDASQQPQGALAYGNLYVITSPITASASEAVINCLKPYLGDRLIQVGTTTFGKNVAQSLFTNANHPRLELWLTTAYLSNASGEGDYSNGLKPDYEVAENYAGTLNPLGEWTETLLAPIYTHLTTGSFPASSGTSQIQSPASVHFSVTANSLDQKPRLTKFRQD